MTIFKLSENNDDNYCKSENKNGRYFADEKTFFDPPKLSSSGFLRSEVSTKNTMALLPSFFIGSDGPIKKNL